MTSNICDISKYSPSRDDRLFFDTNIWVYLLSSPQNPNENLKNAIKEYSRIYTDMVNQGIKILTSWLVLSEFVNRLGRDSFQRYQTLHPGSFKPEEFKRYRNSAEFSSESESIIISVKKILGKSKIISHDLEACSCANVLGWYENKADFNDAVYVEDSIVAHYKIVTHDKDFKRLWGAKAPTILTGNTQMLKP